MLVPGWWSKWWLCTETAHLGASWVAPRCGLVALGLGGTEVYFSLQGAVSVDQVFDPQGGNLTHPHPSPMHQMEHGLVAQGVAGASKTPV